jgi:hypothetical protein
MASSYMTMEITPNQDCNFTETSINKLVEFKIHKALLSFFFLSDKTPLLTIRCLDSSLGQIVGIVRKDMLLPQNSVILLTGTS